MNKFVNLEIDPLILKGIKDKKYIEMTEIQEKTIPFALAGLDLIGQAPTGTGKTMAFSIPILEMLEEGNKLQAIILVPTRELVIQITEEVKELSKYCKGVKIASVYGGEYIQKQIRELKERPQIVIATPGRLMDHMRRKTIKLNDVKFVVLDEADEMLNMGFREDIDTILADVVNPHQTMLFSATISKQIEEIARLYLKSPEIIRVNKGELTISLVDQRYILTSESDKLEIISRIIDLNNYKLTMVFCNTKRLVDEVSAELLQRGFLVEALHGDMKQMQRDRVMMRFKEGKTNILVASDVAARGLDIDNVDVVFNYDVPTDEEYYVHRIGRTGRANKTGLAVTLVTLKEQRKLQSIIRYSKAEIKKLEIPKLDLVLKARIKRYLSNAIIKLEDSGKNIEKHQSLIFNTIKQIEQEYGVTRDILIQGLILSELNNLEDSREIKEISEKPSQKRRKGTNLNSTRMFISLGKKDKLRKFDIADLIVKRTSLDQNNIDRLEMYDNFSFFEVDNKYAEEILAAFTSTRIDGRRVNIEIAKDKNKRRR